MKKLIVFDLDGTLAESKSSLDTEMSALLHDLLGIIKVLNPAAVRGPNGEIYLFPRLATRVNYSRIRKDTHYEIQC